MKNKIAGIDKIIEREDCTPLAHDVSLISNFLSEIGLESVEGSENLWSYKSCTMYLDYLTGKEIGEQSLINKEFIYKIPVITLEDPLNQSKEALEKLEELKEKKDLFLGIVDQLKYNYSKRI